MYNIMPSPVECMHIIQAWSRPLHSGLLSHHNHTENRDQEIMGMNISIYTLSTATDVPVCTSIEDIRTTTGEDAELQTLQAQRIRRELQNEDGLEPSLGGSWPRRYDLAMMMV